MTPLSLPVMNYRARQICHRILAIGVDWAAFSLSGFLAFELRFDFVLPAKYLYAMKGALCIWVFAKSIAFIVGRLDRGSWRYTSAHDTVRIFLANSIGSLLAGVAIYFLLGKWGVPHSVYILDWLLSCLLTLGGKANCSRCQNDQKLNSCEV